MSEVISVLPYNATTLERAAEGAAARVGDVPVRVREMWNPDTCPAAQLPWLAWALSVDVWNADWTDAQKRAAIKASFAVHQRKGTIGAVKLALEALGFGTEVIEWFQQSPAGAPYTFGIDVAFEDRPLEVAVLDEAERIALAAKNVRSHLTKVRGIGSIRGKRYIGMAMMSGEDTTVEPFKLTELATAVKRFLGATAVCSEQTDVLPPSTPASLFRNGELGAFLDPGDLTPDKVAWRRNRLVDTDNPSLWTGAAGGTAVTPVITANVATAPDGSPAHRVQLNKGTGTTTADLASVHFTGGASGSVSVGAPIVQSVWVRSNTAQSYSVLIRDDVAMGAIARVVVVTPEWQRVSVAGSAAATSPSACRLWLRGAQGTSDVADILVAGPQLEYGGTPTNYQRISASPAADFRRAYPNHALWYGALDPRPVTRFGESVGIVLSGAAQWQRIVQPVDQFPIQAAGTTPPTVNSADTYLGEPCVSTTFPVLASGGFSVSRSLADGIGNPARHAIVAGRAYRQSYRIALSRRLTGSEQLQVYTTGSGGTDSAILTPGTPAGVWLDFDSATMILRSPNTGFNTLYAFANSALTAPVTVYVRRYAVDEHAGVTSFQDNVAAQPTLQARRNLLTSTEELSAWTNNGLAITSNAMLAPNGTLTADTSTGTGTRFTSITAIAGLTYTFTHHVRPADPSKTLIIFADGGGLGASQFYTFNPQTLAIIGGAGAQRVSGTIENIGGGWYRMRMTFVAAASGVVACHAYPLNSDLHGWWGAQLEVGSAATPYQAVYSATDYADVFAPRVFRTDGTNDLLETASALPHDANMTAVVSLRHAVSATYPRAILSVRGSNANQEGLVLALNTGNVVTPRAYGTEVISVTAPANEPLIITASKTQATRNRWIRVRRNAGQVSEVTDASAWVTTPAATANVPLRVGANVSTQHMPADYLGITLINRELTARELETTERFYASRAGMTY